MRKEARKEAGNHSQPRSSALLTTAFRMDGPLRNVIAVGLCSDIVANLRALRFPAAGWQAASGNQRLLGRRRDTLFLKDVAAAYNVLVAFIDAHSFQNDEHVDLLLKHSLLRIMFLLQSSARTVFRMTSTRFDRLCLGRHSSMCVVR